jgi:hypothetical protein
MTFFSKSILAACGISRNNFQKLNCGRAVMYADDTLILNTGRNLDELEIVTSDNISKVICSTLKQITYT